MDEFTFHPSILREYDIRGIFGETLFEETAYWLGRCFGHHVREQSGEAIAVARDGRLSSLQLEKSLIKGLCEAGLDVYQLGIGPTPMLYFSEYILPVDAGIMVTASHNPPSHNGFKISLQRCPFFGKDIQSLAHMELKNLDKQQGKVFKINVLSPYTGRLLQGLKFNESMKVAWDPGHGATVNILKTLIKFLPGEHVLLNAEIDGNFPAHPPDTSDPKNLVQLQQIIAGKKCDLGIAFDGDGDRLTAIDSKGRILCGDQLLLLFARDLLRREPNAIIISDIKVSQPLFDEIMCLGGQAIMWKTGNSYIKAKMAESNARLAGETSGHFFFKEDYYGFDDGIYAAMRLLSLLSNSPQDLAELYESLPYLPSTPEIRIPCPSERKFNIPRGIKARLSDQGYSLVDIDGVRVQLNGGWWILRASHTENVLAARCEAYTAEGLKQVIQHLQGELEKEQIFYAIC